FGPLLWAQRCAVCGEQQIFFHDRACARRKIVDEPDLDLLTYLRRSAGRRKDAVPSWTRAQRWTRGRFAEADVHALERRAFGGFEAEHLRADWIMDRLWQAIDETGTGYVHLQGPRGTGKSFIARAIRKEAASLGRGTAVLLYHILPG